MAKKKKKARTKKPTATKKPSAVKPETPVPAAKIRNTPKPKPTKPAFPKKDDQPSLGEFPARLPIDQGKRFEAMRTFLLKQKDVNESFYYYGPKTGWGLRYLHGAQPLCTLLIAGERLVAVVSLDRKTGEDIDWKGLSPIAQQIRQRAHGSPSLQWLDLPLDGAGAADLKIVLRAKLKQRATP
ncbi:MAG: DUF3788 family protein [Deltaproteobacteria bacterium]|nr:DUF3788 family protein [Deltaproteobacteria bacterium]